MSENWELGTGNWENWEKYGMMGYPRKGSVIKFYLPLLHGISQKAEDSTIGTTIFHRL